MNNLIRFFYLLFFSVLIAGCYSTKAVNTAKDVYADTNSNVVFVGYELSMDLSKVHSLYFTCINEFNGELDKCFKIDFNKQNIKHTGAIAARLDNGQYRLAELVKRTIVGQDPVTTCNVVNGSPVCTTTNYDVYENFVVKIEPAVNFIVSDSSAPYLGRLTSQKQPSGNEYIKVENRFEDDLGLIEDAALKEALKSHLTNL